MLGIGLGVLERGEFARRVATTARYVDMLISSAGSCVLTVAAALIALAIDRQCAVGHP
jgi:hypothetical protein